MARLPDRPGSYFRLLAVAVHITGYPVFMRSQRRKTYRECPVLVSSKHYRCNVLILLYHLADAHHLKAPFSSGGTVLSNALASSICQVLISSQVMQSQMIGMQSSLDRILMAVQTQQSNVAAASQQSVYSSGPTNSRDAHGFMPSHRNGFESSGPARSFPPLPGFAPPVSVQHLPEGLVDLSQIIASQICDIWNCSKHCTIFGRRVRRYSP